MSPPNLSAAAPDLYSAMVAWLDWLEGDGDGVGGAAHEQRLLDAMYAAAAKACEVVTPTREGPCHGCGATSDIRIIVDGQPLCGGCRMRWLDEEVTAIAAATGTAKTPQAVECEAAQSGPKGIAR